MRRALHSLLLLALATCLLSAGHRAPTWGFFAHQRINRLAVLTLPPDLMVFFKPNIEYLTTHATDPDMRRYAVSWEAPRHYIDLDEYEGKVEDLPRTWTEALVQYSRIWGVRSAGDTVLIYDGKKPRTDSLERAWRGFFNRQVLRQFSTDDKLLDADSLRHFLQSQGLKAPRVETAFFTENLSAHGILPWNLQTTYRRLVTAFRNRDGQAILKTAADLGHYVGDAHVPLHTTSNYNGQKTNQKGIHGFWESRIPELFADEDYDYFVGKPERIGAPADYFWAMVLASHRSVDSVLNIEQALRRTVPSDQQLCPDTRLGKQVLTQCRDFAAAYQTSMNGMVERRMRAAVHAVSSVWYSAWLEAGAPDLRGISVGQPSVAEQEEEKKIRRLFDLGRILGRPEE